jgi:MerR family transcriptional regulator/heat shock protein HspR
MWAPTNIDRFDRFWGARNLLTVACRFLPAHLSGGQETRMAGASILYRIGEAVDLLGVSVPASKMHEREGLILSLHKASRRRFFSNPDVERIRSLRETINEKKISIAGINRLPGLIPCWRIRNCPPGERNASPSSLSHKTPCWRTATKTCRCSSAECRICPVYTDVTTYDELKGTIILATLAEEP